MDRDVIINNGHFAFKAAFDEHEVVMRGIENVEIRDGIVYVEYPDGTVKSIGALYCTVYCTTPAAEKIKEVTLQAEEGAISTEEIVLHEGQLILVSFKYTNTHESPQLKFNNMAALPIKQDGRNLSYGDLFVNRLYALCYKTDHYDTVGFIELGRKPDSSIGAKSFAFGSNVTASGDYSHSEGYNSSATGFAAHAEGTSVFINSVQTATSADAMGSHAEGGATNVGSGANYGHAEGYHTVVSAAEAGHAEGYQTKAQGLGAHAEGSSYTENNETVLTIASGAASHAEGFATNASREASHAEGKKTSAGGNFSHAEGLLTKTGDANDVTKGTAAHAEGNATIASGNASHAEGNSYIDSRTGSPKTVYTTAQGEASHAEGSGTTAIGDTSHAEGTATIAKSPQSHAEGFATYAGDEHSDENGFSAHAEGSHTRASGNASHAEGISSMSYGAGAHAEGFTATAQGDNSHAEGDNTVASAASSHAEGARYNKDNNKKTTASGFASHAEGEGTKAVGEASHAEGRLTTAGDPIDATNGIAAHAEGIGTFATGEGSHAEGNGGQAEGNFSHAEGSNYSITVGGETEEFILSASGTASHAEGQATTATNEAAHAEGRQTTASGVASHAEGNTTIDTVNNKNVTVYTVASGEASHAEGLGSHATSEGSHAEGRLTTASSVYAHAEGWKTVASGHSSHAEGNQSEANGTYSHAEGLGSIVDGNANWGSHAEGYRTKVFGDSAHAEGKETEAKGDYSHAEGYGTKTNATAQHVEGRYNVESDSYVHIVGNGDGDNSRSNLYILTSNGDAHFKGSVFIQATAADASGGLRLATVESPYFTGIPKADTAEFGTSTKQLATTEFVQEAFKGLDAMLFKGIVYENAHLPFFHEAGWTYKVGAAGTYAGKVCEVGDMIICLADRPPATGDLDDDWGVIQNNIDRAVTSPKSSTTGNIVTYKDGTGLIVEDSGKKFTSEIPYHTSISDNDIPSNSAVETYVVKWIDYRQITINSFTTSATITSPTQSETSYLVEKGATVSQVKLSYKLRDTDNVVKDATAMKLDGSNKTNDAGNMSADGTFTLNFTTPINNDKSNASKTWTLYVEDTRPDGSHKSSTKTTTLKFVNRVFYGEAADPREAANPGEINSAFVRGLRNKPLDEDGVVSNIDITTGENQYMWYCSTKECKFSVGGFNGGFEPAINPVVKVKDMNNVDTNYYVYRSTNSNLGKKTLVVTAKT